MVISLPGKAEFLAAASMRVTLLPALPKSMLLSAAQNCEPQGSTPLPAIPQHSSPHMPNKQTHKRPPTCSPSPKPRSHFLGSTSKEEMERRHSHHQKITGAQRGYHSSSQPDLTPSISLLTGEHTPPCQKPECPSNVILGTGSFCTLPSISPRPASTPMASMRKDRKAGSS